MQITLNKYNLNIFENFSKAYHHFKKYCNSNSQLFAGKLDCWALISLLVEIRIVQPYFIPSHMVCIKKKSVIQIRYFPPALMYVVWKSPAEYAKIQAGKKQLGLIDTSTWAFRCWSSSCEVSRQNNINFNLQNVTRGPSNGDSIFHRWEWEIKWQWDYRMCSHLDMRLKIKGIEESCVVEAAYRCEKENTQFQGMSVHWLIYCQNVGNTSL